MSTTLPTSANSRAATVTVPLRALEKIFGLTAAVACERHALLTRRERQVAAMIAVGKSTRDIAADLNISVKTMDIHRANVKIKLLARTVAEIANFVNLARLAEATEHLPE